MDDDRRRAELENVPQDPEERAVSGHPDHPPQQPDHTVENDRDLLRQGEENPGAESLPEEAQDTFADEAK